MHLKDLRIGVRIGAAFAFVIALMLGAVAVAAFNTHQSEQDAIELFELERQAYVADEWVAHTQLNVTRVVALAKSQAHPAVDEYFKPQISQTTQRISDLQKQLEATVSTPSDKAMLNDIAQLRVKYIEARKQFFDTLKSGNSNSAEEILTNGVLPAADTYTMRMREFAKKQHDAVRTESEVRFAAHAKRVWVLNVVALGVVALTAWVGFAMTRSVTLPLQRAMNFAGEIAKGHLNQALHADRKDEIGALLQSLSAMQGSLITMVSDLQQVASGVDVASQEVAAGTHDLSARTESAASNLAQTASSMERINETVRQSADAARQASQMANTAAEVARRGGNVVTNVVTTMEDISQSSHQIAEIIGVIDGIAFQTNILALNAAVEAARAGEQGRGFAVVAGEVRSLAQRSAQAAREIKELIGNSVGKVQSGSVLVQEAGRTMGEIVASVQRVTDVIGEITAASIEQSDGVNQVRDAIGRLDEMIQQNAALVEESTAAAQSLSTQATRLKEVAGVLTVGPTHKA